MEEKRGISGEERGSGRWRAEAIHAIRSMRHMAYLQEHLPEEIRALEEDMASVASPNLSGIPRGHREGAGEEHLVHLIDERTRLMDLQSQVRQHVLHFVPAWQDLSEEERDMLYSRYVEGEKQEATSARLGIGRSTLYRKREEALTRLIGFMERGGGWRGGHRLPDL